MDHEPMEWKRNLEQENKKNLPAKLILPFPIR
jgi:hypothetical protein